MGSARLPVLFGIRRLPLRLCFLRRKRVIFCCGRWRRGVLRRGSDRHRLLPRRTLRLLVAGITLRMRLIPLRRRRDANRFAGLRPRYGLPLHVGDNRLSPRHGRRFIKGIVADAAQCLGGSCGRSGGDRFSDRMAVTKADHIHHIPAASHGCPKTERRRDRQRRRARYTECPRHHPSVCRKARHRSDGPVGLLNFSASRLRRANARFKNTRPARCPRCTVGFFIVFVIIPFVASTHRTITPGTVAGEGQYIKQPAAQFFGDTDPDQPVKSVSPAAQNTVEALSFRRYYATPGRAWCLTVANYAAGGEIP